jgi:hypothetical protein
MAGRVVVLVVVIGVVAGAALAVLIRLRSAGSGSIPGEALEPTRRGAPAPALQRVLEEDARWLRRRLPPAEPKAPELPRAELGPADAPVEDAAGDPSSKGASVGALAPAPTHTEAPHAHGFRVRSHPRKRDVR